MNLDKTRLYLVAPARLHAGDLAELLPELVDAGVDIVQLREKEMEAGDILRLGAPIRDSCKESGVPFIVNDRPDVAYALGADGVHLGTNDLPPSVARELLPGKLLGLSSHRPEETDAALAATPDYFAVGPVTETPTKPGRPGVGLELVRYAARLGTTTPWYVTGGMNEHTISEVQEAGARRVVVVRAITEAEDPVSAAGRIRAALDEVPL